MPSIQFGRKEQKNKNKMSASRTRTLITALDHKNRKGRRQTKHALFTFKTHQYFSRLMKIGWATLVFPALLFSFKDFLSGKFCAESSSSSLNELIPPGKTNSCVPGGGQEMQRDRRREKQRLRVREKEKWTGSLPSLLLLIKIHPSQRHSAACVRARAYMHVTEHVHALAFLVSPTCTRAKVTKKKKKEQYNWRNVRSNNRYSQNDNSY